MRSKTRSRSTGTFPIVRVQIVSDVLILVVLYVSDAWDTGTADSK